MSRYHNTLFVTTQGSYVAKEGQNLQVRVKDDKKLEVPIHHLSGVVCFGRVNVSPFAMAACLENSVALSFMTEEGRFLGRLEGSTSGNVLLRRMQHRAADDKRGGAALSRSFVLGKIANSRVLLLRAARETDDAAPSEDLRRAAAKLARSLAMLERPEGLTVDALRGIEGDAASVYWSVFDRMIRSGDTAFRFAGRNRRPPRDPVNAVLSFCYAILAHDCAAALRATGLDPDVGFLHTDRPGRMSLALDLMEELRAPVVDRLVLALVNRGQIKGSGFTQGPSGAVRMSDDTRKVVLVEYQKRKQEALKHPFTKEKTTAGLVPHVQSRLLARAIRGDLDAYPPYLLK